MIVLRFKIIGNRNMFNNLRRKAKLIYYNDLIQKNRQNLEKLFEHLAQIVGRTTNKNNKSDEKIINGVKRKQCRHNQEHYSELLISYYKGIHPPQLIY